MMRHKQLEMLINDDFHTQNQEIINYKERARLASARINKRPMTSTRPNKQRIYSSVSRGNEIPKNKNLLQNSSNKNFEFFTNPQSNEVINLIIRSSPTKYDPNLLNKKLKKLNEIYEEKRKNYSSISRVDDLYYKYNLLYGTKSNQLIRSYSPKMRPQSASFSHSHKKDSNSDPNFEKCFNQEEIKLLFHAKCEDLNLKINANLENKFLDYCDRKCVDRVVNFEECNLGIKSAQVLSNIMRYNQNISHLKLSKNSLKDVGLSIIMDSVKDAHNIVSIELASNDLTHKGGDVIFEILLEQQSIISVDLSSSEGTNRNRLTADGVRKLEKILKTNFYLEFLKLGGNSLKNEGLKYILKGLNSNPSLHLLDLSNNEINSFGISYFQDYLKTSKLINLDLSFNQISDQGLEKLSKCINQPSLNSLKNLNLASCNIKAEGIVAFLSALQNNKILEILNLNKNNFSGENFEMIKNNFYLVNIKELKLSGCKLGDNGAALIAEGLYLNCVLKSLDISDNKISDKGFVYFIEVPIKNYSLEILDVSRNMLTDSTCKEFTKNLERSSLKKLNFYDNQLRNETGTSLISSLRVNKNIVKMNIKLNRIHTRISGEIKRLLKLNLENSKHRFIPNLKKEIRQNFVEKSDFEETEKKIQEVYENGKTLNEKLKEDLIKFANLKILEEVRLKEKVEEVKLSNKNLKELEENLKKLNNEQKIMQINFNSQSEIFNKDIVKLQDSIKTLEFNQKEIKFSQDMMKKDYEFELYEINLDFKKSEEKINTAALTMESIKKELKIRNNLLERLQKNEEAETTSLRTVGRKNSQLNNSPKISILISKNDVTKNDSTRKLSSLKLQNYGAEIDTIKKDVAEIKIVEKEKKKTKSRPKSHNPVKNPAKRYKLKKPNI